MTILEYQPAVALDESAQEFISTFMSHVATVSGYGTNRIATIVRIKNLLLTAIARGDGGSSTAWSAFHRAIVELVAANGAAIHTRTAHDYLESFIRENADLARD